MTDKERLLKLLEKYRRKEKECHRLKEKIKKLERNQCKCEGEK